MGEPAKGAAGGSRVSVSMCWVEAVWDAMEPLRVDGLKERVRRDRERRRRLTARGPSSARGEAERQVSSYASPQQRVVSTYHTRLRFWPTPTAISVSSRLV